MNALISEKNDVILQKKNKKKIDRDFYILCSTNHYISFFQRSIQFAQNLLIYVYAELLNFHILIFKE